MIDSHVLSYLAGVIDSDGSIGIKRSTYAMRVRGDAGQPIYSEAIHVQQVEPHAVNLLREAFGGNLHLSRPPGRRPIWSWHTHSAAAARALALIRPHLRIKAEQADNALALRALIERSRRERRWSVPAIVDGEPMVTATEFAQLVGAKQTSILQACAKGSVPSCRVGRSRMMPRSFADAYRARMGRKGGAPSRPAYITAEMEALYQRAKELNRVGI